VRDFCVYREVFGDGPLNAVNRVFTDRPPLPWQQNLRQNWLKLGLCKRILRDFCVNTGVWEDGPANAANRILPRLTLVAMGTKFGTKRAITRHYVWDIFGEDRLHLSSAEAVSAQSNAQSILVIKQQVHVQNISLYLLTATLKKSHIENSKNHKRWYCPHHTDCVCQCAAE